MAAAPTVLQSSRVPNAGSKPKIGAPLDVTVVQTLDPGDRRLLYVNGEGFEFAGLDSQGRRIYRDQRRPRRG